MKKSSKSNARNQAIVPSDTHFAEPSSFASLLRLEGADEYSG
jgi:hypothetical protein